MSPTYQPVGRRRLTDEIVDQIKDLIIKSELRVGDPLPPERELARQLQVSRNALREAIGKLAEKGLVEVRPGSGTYIAIPSAAFIGDSLEFLLRFNRSLLLELVEARVAVECETAVRAAERRSEENLRVMREALEKMDAHRRDLETYIEADLLFHTELARAARNQVLLLFMLSLRGALRENIRYFASDPNIVDASVLNHHLVYNAVAAGDPEQARVAMIKHFTHFVEHLRASLQQLSSASLAEVSQEATHVGNSVAY